MMEREMAARFDEATASLGALGITLRKLPERVRAQVQEVRLRAGRPVVLALAGKDLYLTCAGVVSEQMGKHVLVAMRPQLEDAFRLICDSSVYAHQHEIRCGFVTLRGGHRAGLCGTAVLQSGTVTNLRDISGINLRIAREFRGAADGFLAALGTKERMRGAILAGPPGCGKTTVLRDLARQLSSGALGRCRVSIVDERGEIAATFKGVPQNDVGQCDVLDGYPKGEGIMQSVRCLSPDVIICDEIGGEEDARAVAASLNAGVSFIASAHASSMKELFARPHMRTIFETGAFPQAALLCGRERPGRVKAFYREGELHDFQAVGADDAVWRLHDGRAS
ncbi:MAG: AAA family ATPase [Ethanoligenens sp.]